MEKKLIRVALVDDEIKALKRMNLLLQKFPEVTIVKQFQSPDKVVDFAIKNKPDILFLDIEMPGVTGMELAEQINKNSSETKVVFTTSHDHYAIKAIKRDAFDYLLKPIGMDELKETLDKYGSKFQAKLSVREQEIIRLIAKGYNSEKIGKELFLSRHTIDTHRRKILKKTGCKNSAELIKYAVQNKMV